ncbi:MAG: YjbF family lipoprotein [Motiliproteus sp.]
MIKKCAFGSQLPGLLVPGLLVLGLLSGCSGSSALSSAVNLLELSIVGNTEAAYSDDYVRNLPYASISVKIGKGQKSLLVLGKIEANQYYWYSADRAILVTESGRIVKTRGLETDLSLSSSRTPDPLMAIQKDANGEQMAPYTRLLDYSRHEVFGVAQRFSLRRVTAEQVELLGDTYTADRYEEQFEVKALDWSEANQYWLDTQTRRLLKSVQFFAPDSPSVTIEYLSIVTP